MAYKCHGCGMDLPPDYRNAYCRDCQRIGDELDGHWGASEESEEDY